MILTENIILKTALETIKIESQTIAALASKIDASFETLIRVIHASHGRLVITGIGKSALVGKKIVATLNSTGTPALFMHAADAIHGDLGMIQSDDIVWCISKSGETSEIKVLVPMLRQLGNALIAMVSNPNSFLGQQADYILHTPVIKEADPNNLAPTASSAAQMAMGDAVATSLLALKGFTSQDFAQFHPGGSLGKKLYLRVSDLCSNNDRPAIQQDDNIQAIIIEISGKRLGCTAVLNKSKQVVGIITDGDLRRMLQKTTDIAQLKASEIMTPDPKFIRKNALCVKALELMRQHSITQLIVLNENDQYEGIIHLHDLIKEGIV